MSELGPMSVEGTGAEGGGPSILYPRAATLGGCTAHNFLIAIKPHDSD